jgi:hypothetical protein
MKKSQCQPTGQVIVPGVPGAASVSVPAPFFGLLQTGPCGGGDASTATSLATSPSSVASSSGASSPPQPPHPVRHVRMRGATTVLSGDVDVAHSTRGAPSFLTPDDIAHELRAQAYRLSQDMGAVKIGSSVRGRKWWGVIPRMEGRADAVGSRSRSRRARARVRLRRRRSTTSATRRRSSAGPRPTRARTWCRSRCSSDPGSRSRRSTQRRPPRSASGRTSCAAFARLRSALDVPRLSRGQA